MSLQRTIEAQLVGLERLLGPDYELTVIACYKGKKDLDADTLLTNTPRSRIEQVIRRLPEDHPPRRRLG